MDTIKWLNFVPIKGGSFGRNDMGIFCEVDGIIFVVTQLESSTGRFSRKEIEKKIAGITQSKTDHNQYELMDGKFEASSSIDWRKKIRDSAIATEEWLM
jgi:hypothetical protein